MNLKSRNCMYNLMIKSKLEKETETMKNIRHSLVSKENENEEFNTKLRHLEFENLNLQNNNTKLQEELIILQQFSSKERSDYHDQIKNLEEKLKDFSQNRNSSLNRNSIETEEMVKLPKLAVDTLDRMLEEKEEELIAIKKELEEKNNEILQLKTEEKGKERKKKSFSSDESDQESESKKRIEVLVQETSRLNEKIFDYQNENEKLNSQIKEKVSEIENLNKEKVSLEEKIISLNELTTEFVVLNEKLNTSENSLLEVLQEKSNLKNELEELKIKVEKEKSEVLNSKNASLEEKDKELETLKQQINSLNGKISEMSQVLITNEALIDQLNNEILSQKEENKLLEKLKEETALALNQLNENKQKESSNDEQKLLQIENHFKEERNRFEHEILEKSNEIKRLKALEENLHSSIKEDSQLKTEFESKIKEIEKLSIENENLKAKIKEQSEVFNEKEKLLSELSELTSSLEEKDRELDEKDKENEKLKKMMIDVNEIELEQKNNEIKRLKEELSKLETKKEEESNRKKSESEFQINSRDELEEKMNRAQEAQRNAELELGNFNIYLENLTKELESEQAITQSQKVEIQKLNETILVLNEELQKREKGKDHKCTCKENEITGEYLGKSETETNLQKEIQSLKEELEQFKVTSTQTKHIENFEIQEKLIQISSNEKLMNEKLNEVQNENSQLQKKILEQEHTISLYENQMKSLNDEFMSRKESRFRNENSLKEESKSVKNNLTEFKQESMRALKALNDQILVLKSENQTLKNELKKEKDSHTITRKRCESIDFQLKENQRKLVRENFSMKNETPKNSEKKKFRFHSPNVSRSIKLSPQHTLQSPKNESTSFVSKDFKIQTILFIKCQKYFFCPYIEILDQNHINFSKSYLQKSKNVPYNTEIKKYFFDEIILKQEKLESKVQKMILKSDCEPIIIYGSQNSQKCLIKLAILNQMKELASNNKNVIIKKYTASFENDAKSDFIECLFDYRKTDLKILQTHIDQLKQYSQESDSNKESKNEKSNERFSIDLYLFEIDQKKLKVVCSNFIKKAFKFSDSKEKILRDIFAFDKIEDKFLELFGAEFFNGDKNVFITINPAITDNVHKETSQTLAIIPYLQKQDRSFLAKETTNESKSPLTNSNYKPQPVSLFIQDSKPLKEQINSLKKDNDELNRKVGLLIKLTHSEKFSALSQNKVKELEVKVKAMASKMQDLIQNISKISQDKTSTKTKRTLMRVPTHEKLNKTILTMRKMIDEALYSNLDLDFEKSKTMSSPVRNKYSEKYTKTKEDDLNNRKDNLVLDKAIMKINTSSEEEYDAENEEESAHDNEKEPEIVQKEEKKVSIIGKRTSARGSAFEDDEVL